MLCLSGFASVQSAYAASLPSKESKQLAHQMHMRAKQNADFEKSRGIDPVYGVVGVVLWQEGQPKSKGA